MAININLNSMCKRGFNAPVVQGCPLYKNVDGYRGEDATIKSGASEKLLRNIASRYNSPDNVRRLFISYKEIVVEFYKPVKGDKNTSLIRRIPWARSARNKKGNKVLVNVDMKEVIQDFYNWALSSGKSSRKYKINGNPFKALISPYVLQNLEEIYFDMSMLISDDIINRGLSNVVLKLLQTKDKEYKDNNKDIETIFKIAVLGDKDKDITKQFPRLRAIGYIERLGELYDRIPSKPGMNSIEDMKKIWFNSGGVLKEVQNPNTCIRLCTISGIPKLNTNFSIKAGIYAFDKEVLNEYSENLKLRIEKHYESEKAKLSEEKKKEAQNVMDNEKSAVEITLDKMYELFNGDENKLKEQVVVLFLGRSIKEKEKEISLFSKQGKDRYGKYIKS